MGSFRSRSRRLPRLEPLERRQLLAAAPMSPVEHHVHELVNLVRAHPADASAFYGLELNAGIGSVTISETPKQPLRRSEFLRDVLEPHLEDMLQNNFFSHTGSDGSTFISRIESAGLTEWEDLGENLAWGGNESELGDLLPIADQLVAGLYTSPSHRLTLFNEFFKEAGTSFLTGLFEQSGTTYHAAFTGQDYALRESSSSFLTGMACAARHVRFAICNVDQPLADATLRLSGPNGEQLEIQTGANGEFDLELSDGVWRLDLEAEGQPPFDPIEVTVGPDNVHVSFMPPPNQVWHNSVNGLDVNGDSVVTSIDALIVINSLNADGPRALPQDVAFLPAFLDINGDNQVAPGDALAVINVLNQSSGEGESVVRDATASGEGLTLLACRFCSTAGVANEPHTSRPVPDVWSAVDKGVSELTLPVPPSSVGPPVAKTPRRVAGGGGTETENDVALLELLGAEEAEAPSLPR